MTDYLISSLSGDQPKITVDTIDPDGRLQPASHVDLEGGPGPLAVSPDGRHLYAGVNIDGSHQALSYRLSADGTLTQTGQTDMGANPCQLATDRSGRFLLGAYYSDGMVTVDPIDAEGALGGPRWPA